MSITSLPPHAGLNVSYEFSEATEPRSTQMTVLHHGMSHSRAMFEPLVGELLDRGVDVATVDQQTDKNWTGLSAYREGLAAALRQIQQDTGKRIGSICGHSMGGLIVQETMQKYEDFRMPTVLMAPIPLGGALPATARTILKHPLKYLEMAATMNVKRAFNEESVRTLFFDRETPYPIVQKTTDQITDTPYLAYLQLGPRRLTRPWIEDTDQPTMLLCSDTDFLFRPHEYESMRRLYNPDRFEEHRIHGGHDFFIEHAAETADQIARFHRIHAR